MLLISYVFTFIFLRIIVLPFQKVNKVVWLVDWPLMGGLLHLVYRGRAWVDCGPAQSPSRCTKCNSPPINGQSTNFISFDVTLCTLHSKGLKSTSAISDIYSLYCLIGRSTTSDKQSRHVVARVRLPSTLVTKLLRFSKSISIKYLPL